MEQFPLQLAGKRTKSFSHFRKIRTKIFLSRICHDENSYTSPGIRKYGGGRGSYRRPRPRPAPCHHVQQPLRPGIQHRPGAPSPRRTALPQPFRESFPIRRIDYGSDRHGGVYPRALLILFKTTPDTLPARMGSCDSPEGHKGGGAAMGGFKVFVSISELFGESSLRGVCPQPPLQYLLCAIVF